ncbi:hypothetical protein FOCG_09062 [Fusarium oxysporum f. sp. radicis-lycopersici 26381]|uniref:Uncharacterized protein n=1 Tax=Fusarium oxysporum Fo47 TaxID=660027 RepID=W9KBK7_FUSOX|nr:hypothetical protein FOZG_08470 [Fusarium oxysporum Fo47]EXL50888.1 hypothetical protein FOCG_09062 [Fusarium oxysporum f. sp. radicis-lycopersici 26381]
MSFWVLTDSKGPTCQMILKRKKHTATKWDSWEPNGIVILGRKFLTRQRRKILTHPAYSRASQLMVVSGSYTQHFHGPEGKALEESAMHWRWKSAVTRSKNLVAPFMKIPKTVPTLTSMAPEMGKGTSLKILLHVERIEPYQRVSMTNPILATKGLIFRLAIPFITCRTIIY